MIIAQRFNVGMGIPGRIRVPKGRLTISIPPRCREAYTIACVLGDRCFRPSLRDLGRSVPHHPTLKRWAIFGGPLRDRDRRRDGRAEHNQRGCPTRSRTGPLRDRDRAAPRFSKTPGRRIHRAGSHPGRGD